MGIAVAIVALWCMVAYNQHCKRKHIAANWREMKIRAGVNNWRAMTGKWQESEHLHPIALDSRLAQQQMLTSVCWDDHGDRDDDSPEGIR